MIGPLLCFGLLCVLGSGGGQQQRDRRRVPRRGDPFDRALAYAMRQQWSADEVVAYVVSRVEPGRENDVATVRRVRDEVVRRLARSNDAPTKRPSPTKKPCGVCRG